jgi:hypothetical protein
MSGGSGYNGPDLSPDPKGVSLMDPVAYFVFGIFFLLILIAIIVPHLGRDKNAPNA